MRDCRLSNQSSAASSSGSLTAPSPSSGRVELARGGQLGGCVDDPGDDHGEHQRDQAGGCSAGHQEAIEADLACGAEHRGDLAVRQTAQHPLASGSTSGA
ncbi:MAG: hypothetical protein M0002_16840, partial [Rhodospirillales bacterium]|nr:hypothetical protein [Rhodospirillales bacterium]